MPMPTTLRPLLRRAALGVLPLLLAACGSTDGVAYKVEGQREQAITLIREQNFPWSDWDVSVVVSGQPACMRRHHIRPVSWGATFKVELYRSLEGNFILHQGKRWYAAETGQCQLQQYKEGPPVEPGDLLGTFAVVDGVLKFKPAPASESGTAPAPAS